MLTYNMFHIASQHNNMEKYFSRVLPMEVELQNVRYVGYFRDLNISFLKNPYFLFTENKKKIRNVLCFFNKKNLKNVKRN